MIDLVGKQCVPCSRNTSSDHGPLPRETVPRGCAGPSRNFSFPYSAVARSCLRDSGGALVTISEPHVILTLCIGSVIGLDLRRGPPDWAASSPCPCCCRSRSPGTPSPRSTCSPASWEPALSAAPSAPSCSTPRGTPVNAATCFDGYPMAKRGEAARALGAVGRGLPPGGAVRALDPGAADPGHAPAGCWPSVTRRSSGWWCSGWSPPPPSARARC